MTLPTDLVSLVAALAASLETGGIRHAFGGAIALAYAAEPRATYDIDIDVFSASFGAPCVRV